MQQSPPPLDLRIRAEDALLRVRIDGAGPTVVLVHGWALDLEVWEPQVAALRDSFRLVRYDRPGFGESSGTPSTAADVAALRAVVAHCELRSFALVAASQAGRGALRYALEAPHMLNALVLDGVPLEGFPAGPRPEHAPPVPQLSAALLAGGVDEVRRQLAANEFFRLRTADPAAHALLARVLARYPARDLASPATAEAPANVAARLGELAVPALVVNGEHDSPHRRLVGDALAYGLPTARRVVIPGAGHLASLDRAADYAALLRDFLHAHRHAA